nr:hypothetical protein [uncultured bacterium]
MPFGLGAFETLLVLAIVVGIPIALVVLLVRAMARRPGADGPTGPQVGRHQTAELDSTRHRLEELEAKLACTEEKVAFTESLLDDRRKGS